MSGAFGAGDTAGRQLFKALRPVRHREPGRGVGGGGEPRVGVEVRVGGHGVRVDKASELAGGLARARDVVVKEKRQALLNVICPP